MHLSGADLQAGHGYRYLDGPRFAVLDVETTGLCAETNNIVEISIIDLQPDGSIDAEWSSLIHAPGDGALGASNIHGITREMLVDAPAFAGLVDEIADRLRNRIVVGHYVSFDLADLSSECSRINYQLPNISSAAICTRDLAHRFLPPGPRTLKSCCEAIGIQICGAHSAHGDSRATAELFRHFIDKMEWSTIDHLVHHVELLAWPPHFALAQGTTRAVPR